MSKMWKQCVVLTAVLVAVWTGSAFAAVGDVGDLYVATHTDNSVIQFDVPTFTREPGSFATGTGDQAFGLAFSPDGSRLFVSGKNAAAVKEYDGATGGLVATVIDVSGETGRPAGLALSPDGSTLYVTDVENLKLTAYDTTNFLAGDVWTGIDSAAEYVAINAAGTRAYTGGSGRIHEIDLTSGGGAATVFSQSPLGGGEEFIGTGIKVHPVTGNILVAHRGFPARFTDSVIEIDAATGDYLRTVVGGIDGQPTGLGLSLDGSTLYVGHNACCGASNALLRKYGFTASGLFSFLGDIPATSTRLNDMAIRPVPEPATLAMIGLGGLLLLRRRRA